MKYITLFFTLLAFSLIFIGVYYDFFTTNQVLEDKFYGMGTVCLFFLAIPTFLISRRNKTNIKKYMLNKDLLKKDEESK